MSILIKHESMPDTCSVCPLMRDNGCCITGYQWISRTYIDVNFNPTKKRLKDCPLVEIKSHGDLIDKDELLNRSILNPFYAPYITMHDIKNVSIVIEAEGTDE